ncbi:MULTISPECIES: ABC transporter ATP-binding protein [unclassified Clostridioides]|uniref:ABC transporter ATP-binding protein n=1 Tax=unclassified Clostridioides TaxID=2635829 RepID=UPI001D0BF68E|nr:ABC transporter ATP-binding protein [Clostridioides sp. ES-S-0001-02]MCC0652000.1 ABC transporter ATP-binding protein [Clostridioides sp. ES-S-0001-03]MCC0657805.1 ABC transporter ATP-binding protein [Clostridioides sp. ES-S-0123-01]MCC0673342.1 ABC transporter ATP-binding protein [Clostridioides sp. ES-S-0145-01]UDN57116.1 ABC transporter ATP-binding protein [Clostridioides sp. ES-S-0010-02]UDN63290.1 ABC transporter ATP-binding protein [Clostridioides sp. ES-W-0016-02]
MSNSIRIKNLSHSFKKQKIFDNVSLNFEENKIYGLLGKNGAGKTTLLNIIVNQLIQSEGDIEISGKNIKEDLKVLEDICIVREKEFYNSDFKVGQIFEFSSSFYKNYDKALEEKLCKYFDLNIKKKYRQLSRGMKTILSNIIGICSNSAITIFDEPTIGLDAVNRQEFYNVILDNYIKNPRTIIISTHLIDEIDDLLEHVIILNEGKIIIDEDIDTIKQKAHYITGSREEVEKLEAIRNVKPKKSFGNTVAYFYYGDFNKNDENILKNSNIDVGYIGLQDMFVSMTKKEVL